MNQENLLGERIKELRTEQKISQEDLAKVLQISRLTIGKYERGERIPDANTINILSHIFYVSADYLLGISDAKNPEYQEIMSEYGLTEKSAEVLKFFITGIEIPADCKKKDKRSLTDVFNQFLCSDSFKELILDIMETTSKDNMIEDGEALNTIEYSTSTVEIDAFEKRATEALKKIMQEIRTSEYFDLIENIK